MTAQEYLEGIERAERKIEAITRRLEELRTRAEGVGAIRYDKDRVQTSPQDSMPDKVIKLCEIEDKYREAVIRAEVYKHEIHRDPDGPVHRPPHMGGRRRENLILPGPCDPAAPRGAAGVRRNEQRHYRRAR